ncbi:MAG: metal dependent phosphohydrolase [Pelosinus sp.]|jgi:HD-GYP domain-containing protein (c-di-GMP phosphodiesterase class II)|nr:metal dependent phosphohydrolase [Pelosinus sp.]
MLLNDVKENMILAQDIVDKYGRTLVTAGIPLKPELINLLKKHEILSICVRSDKTTNYEISEIHDLICIETRLKLISNVENAFTSSDGLVRHLTQLQNYIEDIVSKLASNKNVLMYLDDMNCASDYLFMHSVNVGLFSIIIGIAMDLPYDELCLLGMGGLLHDFGKTRITKQILDKQSQLTLEEFNQIKEHATLGYNVLKVDTYLDYRITFMALQHHERCNGSGYPWGIPRCQIHPLARIVAVADVYDALTTNRVYRSRLSSFEAIEIINNGNGIHFDSDVITAFNSIAIPYQIDNNVKLTNGIAGKVLRLNSSNLARPLVSTPAGIINLLHEPDIAIIATSY